MALRAEERIVAGDAGDEVLVHHLVLRGSNRSIGRHLGEIARTRYGVAPPQAEDPLRVRVQRDWLRRNAPVMFERVRGAGDALGVDVADDAYDVSHLGEPPASPGCSAAFLPARRSASGHPLVSRSYDFAGPLQRPRRGGPPPASRPYVVELHPDAGHPSLALSAFDLLGAIEGMNGEGLVVAAASDEESAARAGLEPAGPSVGLDELQLVRHLLDTCATAMAAREAVLAVKHYYAAHPVHFLVADRHGDAFVFELSPGRNRQHLVDAEGSALVMTNHPLHRYRGSSPPGEPGPGATYDRWRALATAIEAARRPLDETSLGRAVEQACSVGGRARTLWAGVYDPVARSLAARFLVREGVRTQPIRFSLAA